MDHLEGAEDNLGHPWLAPVDQFERLGVSDRSVVVYMTRERAGDYATPLPLPEERIAIRVAAGFTQAQLAEEVLVPRHTLTSYERAAGPRTARIAPRGREPRGEVRERYAQVLLMCLRGELSAT